MEVIATLARWMETAAPSAPARRLAPLAGPEFDEDALLVRRPGR